MKTSSPRRTVTERRELGRALRKRAPRTIDAEWPPESARPDPIGLLEKHSRQALDRLTEEVDGEYRIKSESPLLLPLRELAPIIHKQSAASP